jgi:23S rRNA pseudouridine2605 synthase
MRLAKFIAGAGLASRREAEKLILEGKVHVNGKKILELVTFIQPEDKIELNGKLVEKTNNIKLYKFYKPKDVITSRRDPQARVTLFDLLPEDKKNLITIGRLDYKTEGLILLTNNGDLSRYFELPKNKIRRNYKVKVFGKILSEKALDKIRSGIEIDAIKYQSIEINYQGNHWYDMTLFEGKNREIRKIFEFFGCLVSRLIRISYDNYSLEGMKPRDLVEVNFISQLKSLS